MACEQPADIQPVAPSPVVQDVLVITVAHGSFRPPAYGTLVTKLIPPSNLHPVILAGLWSGLDPAGHGLHHPATHQASDGGWLVDAMAAHQITPFASLPKPTPAKRTPGGKRKKSAPSKPPLPPLSDRHPELWRPFQQLPGLTPANLTEHIGEHQNPTLLWLHLQAGDSDLVHRWIDAYKNDNRGGQVLVVNLPDPHAQLGEPTSAWWYDGGPKTPLNQLSQICTVIDLHASLAEPLLIPSDGVSIKNGCSNEAWSGIAGGPGLGPKEQWTLPSSTVHLHPTPWVEQDGQPVACESNCERTPVWQTTPEAIRSRTLGQVLRDIRQRGWFPLSQTRSIAEQTESMNDSKGRHARAYAQLPQYRRAVDMLDYRPSKVPQQILSLHDMGLDTRWLQSAVEQRQGRPAGQLLLDGRPDPAAKAQAAHAYWMAGQIEQAKALLEQAEGMDPMVQGMRALLDPDAPLPSSLGPWQTTAQILREPNLHAALELGRKGVMDYPDSATVWAAFAEVAWESGLANEALESCERSLQLQPANRLFREKAAGWALEMSEGERAARWLAPMRDDPKIRRMIRRGRRLREEPNWHQVRVDRSGRFEREALERGWAIGIPRR